MASFSPVQRFYIKRFIGYFFTLLIALTINFILPRLRDVGPVDTIMAFSGAASTTQGEIDETVSVIEKRFNLDKPLWQQYLYYIKSVVTFDFGYSITRYPMKVWDIISENVVWTLFLQIPAIIIGYLLGNLLGVVAAYKRGGYDKILYPTSLFLSSIPYFCVAIILVYVFGIKLEWFPSMGGYSDLVEKGFYFPFIMSAIYHYILPFLSLLLVLIGGQAIGMRSVSVYELNSDYVNYARALGVSDKNIMKYVLRNAMLPQLTTMALALGLMVGGALLIEIIFSYPGIGSAIFKAVKSSDYPIVQAGLLLVTFNVLLFNFIADVLITKFDPRVRAAIEEDLK